MAPVLAEAGYVVDTSVNPSWLVKSKAGGAAWKSVVDAMENAGLTERPWLTRRTLPVNGPALFKFPLSLNAKAAWKRAPPCSLPTNWLRWKTRRKPSPRSTATCLTFARHAGTWQPPLEA